MFGDPPPPETVQALFRLDIRLLATTGAEVKIFRSDDGFAYAYVENGIVQGRKERLGPWR